LKKFLIFLFTVFFALTAFAGKRVSPMLGQWSSSDGKDYMTIIKDDENQGLIIKKDGLKYELTEYNQIYIFKNKTENVQVYLNPSNGNLELLSNNKKIVFKKIIKFIELNLLNISFLLILGFIGGLVSGFIGSGGAFVLTPGMMSLGVDGLVAIASNMCHKFPKALVGAFKRYKYGQVDLKLGLIMASCALLGVLVGIDIQQKINNAYGNLGSDLYVSLAYVIVLTSIGSYVFYDAYRTQNSGGIEKKSKLSLVLKNINLPPKAKLKVADSVISIWFILPIGFLTGMLAATIAVGGFIGVPGMIFVLGAPSVVASATELVVAFSMGLVGSIKWGLMGLIDIRLTVIILAGSLFGVQIGAYGTTFVNQNYIKKVMGTIMLLVALSRGIIIPSYLSELSFINISDNINMFLKNLSFVVMFLALGTGAFMITKSMWKAKK
tara:strand:+ start:743 stop:2053 length:1311 start_codon:yes stop_codon:yes gene_type:complete